MYLIVFFVGSGDQSFLTTFTLLENAFLSTVVFSDTEMLPVKLSQPLNAFSFMRLNPAGSSSPLIPVL